MGSVHDAQGSIQLDFSNSQGWNLHTVEQVAQRCCGCHVVCLFLSFKSSLNICFSLCLSSTTLVRFGKIFFKGSERKDMEAAVLHVSRYPDLPVYSLNFLCYR